jgi:hypothetical protein
VPWFSKALAYLVLRCSILRRLKVTRLLRHQERTSHAGENKADIEDLSYHIHLVMLCFLLIIVGRSA